MESVMLNSPQSRFWLNSAERIKTNPRYALICSWDTVAALAAGRFAAASCVEFYRRHDRSSMLLQGSVAVKTRRRGCLLRVLVLY